MRNQKLKRRLQEWNVPEFDRNARKELEIAVIPSGINVPGRLRMNCREFFASQMRLIRKRTYLWKMLLVVCALAVIHGGTLKGEIWSWTMAAVAGPLLCLTNMQELCNVCRRGMWEMHLTARFSLKHVLLVRLAVFGGVDLALSAAVLLAVWLQGYEAGRLGLYFGVPYGLTFFGCIAVLNRMKEEDGMTACLIVGGCVAMGILFLRITGSGLFEEGKTFFWIMVGLLAAAGILKEGFRLLHNAGGAGYEIEHGTFV